VPGLVPTGFWVGTGETDAPGVLLIMGTDADGLGLIGFEPGLKPGFNPLLGFVFGTILVGRPVLPDGALWLLPDVLPD
jgi:hypothetical protein